ncbi:MAG: ABC transporter permease [Thermoplasmata archaeon]
MASSGPCSRALPSEIKQSLIVARYELLKYLRSRRLIGTVMIVAIIVGLIYALPPALGSPYAGHVEETLDLRPVPAYFGLYMYPNATVGNLSRGGIQAESIEITVNGTVLPESMWIYRSDMRAVILLQNYSSSEVIASYDFKRSTNGFTENFLQFGSILVIICSIFFGADSIVSEYQNRTAYLIFPNPMRREVLFAGKMMASFAASLLMVSIFYLAILVLSYTTLGESAKYLYLSFLYASMFLLGCLGLAYFISSVMKGSTGAIILTFFILTMISQIIIGVGSLAGVKMWFMLTFAGDTIVESINADNYPVDSSYEFGGFGTIYNFYPDLGTSVVVMLAYFIAFSLISVMLFKRKQLLG